MSQRTFLITGASKGIGRALSERLAGAGHQVVGLARHGGAPGFPGTLVSVDLGNREDTDKVLADLTSRFSFDGVVDDAALLRAHRIGEVELDEIDDLFRIGLHPAVQTVQATLPAMREKGWGRIINISSVTILGYLERTGYAAVKSAMVSFTRTWALELARTGITVNAVAPGATETEMFREYSPPGSEGERRALSMTPMNRLGKPEEIAAAIAFLLSEDASFITGQTLFVDGGASLSKAAF